MGRAPAGRGDVQVLAQVLAPRATRLVCAGLGAVTVADWLQYAWTLTEQEAEG
ncbi:hypothetical protein ACH4C2_23760 [Streptomyces sp. NPDC018057]|uniref:hypothetical protein n=1 Tax=unclassified Streptomyces TaxID=2593676 RepID=UPI00378F30FA